MRVVLTVVVVLILATVLVSVAYATARALHRSAWARAESRAQWEPVSTPDGAGMLAVGVRKVARRRRRTRELAREPVTSVDPSDGPGLLEALTQAATRAGLYNTTVGTS